MTHRDAENQVKRLQKELLIWLEEHLTVDALSFEEIRRNVFRGSFAAFRLGVLGLVKAGHMDYPETGYLGRFIGNPVYFNFTQHPELPERYFRLMLESFRLGTTVYAQRDLLEVQSALERSL